MGSQPATVISADLHELVVRSPAYGSTGAVAVEVETATGYGASTGSFTYWADGAGKAGVLGTLIWSDTVGGYWADAQEGFAYAYFIDPQDVHWWQFMVDTMDTCENDGFTPAASATILDTTGLNSLRMSAGSRNIDLTYNASTLAFENNALTASTYGAGSTYNLLAPTSVFPAEDVSSFVTAAAASTISTPNIGGSTPPTLTKAQTFTWNSASITADWILIEMYLLNSGATAIADGVVCVARNDGSFAVNGAKWASWTTGRQVNVFFGPTIEATGTLPWNGADSRMTGTYYIVGAGFAG
jgi:hypothetical protein